MAEQAKEFTGLWVPKEILCDTNLNLTERIILSAIVALSKSGACIATNQYLADAMGLSKMQARRAVYSLVEKKYISSRLERDYDTSHVNKRIISPMCKYEQGPCADLNNLCSDLHTPYVQKCTPPMGENAHPLCSDLHTPYVQKCTKNNIDNNIVNNIEDRIEDTTTTPAAELITFWESNLGILTPFMLQQINSIIDDHGVAWTRKAMEETAGAGVEKPFPYFKGIVRNWEASKKPEPWTKVTPIKREQTATERAYAIREQARKLIAESEEEENDAM